MIYIFNDKEFKLTHKTCLKTIETNSSEIFIVNNDDDDIKLKI